MIKFLPQFFRYISMCFLYAVYPQISFNLDVPDLNRENYKIWNERILLQLGSMDIDDAIRKDEPVITKPENSDQVVLHEH